MQIFRTATCAHSGHPEFTLVFKDEPPTPNTVGWILDHLQNAVTDGVRFVPGQPVGIGWRALRVIERGDGTLGLEERVGEDVWQEQLDQALGDLWWQVEAAAKLRLPEELDSVAEDHIATVQSCAFDASTLILYRVGPDSPQRGGWAIGCGDEHDHLDWSFMELFRVSAALPFVTQFLALPPETGVLINRQRVGPAGGVVADVSYKDIALSPDDGMYFGPQPPSEEAFPKAHFAIGRIGEGLYRTMIGDRHGHPDIVARLTTPPIPGLQDSLVHWILDDLQDSIAAGTRFAPGQTIRVGWRILCVVDRADGMLGLKERVDVDRWEEHVELTLRDVWYQKEVAASLGLTKRLAFPGENQYAAVAECVNDTIPTVLISRAESDDPASSGWRVSCWREHDHGRWSSQSIWNLSDSMPFATQFLALPVTTSVVIEAPHLTATGRIGVRVLLDGRHILPEPGSYLAALNGRG